MADRFYINTTNLVTFSAGERPTADKFNAVNKYFSRGLNSLARVIGDAHDDGAPHNLGTSIYLTNKWNRSGVDNQRPLDILNLARIIGPASNLNPKYLNRLDHVSRMIQETIPSGVLEYYPKFPIDSLGTVIPNSEFIANKGFIRFESNTTEDIQFQYIPKNAELIEGGPNYIDAEFNVIPDPNTPVNDPTFKLDIIELVDGTYRITLPTVGFQQSKLSNLNDSNIDVSEPNNAAQLKLPKWIQDLGVNYNGEVLPQGTIFLKDRTTGESFIDAHYIYVSDTEIKADRLELCLDQDHDFCLVVVGTDITTTLDDLRNKTFLHKHDGSFGEPRISIYDLKDVFKYAPPSGAYKESELSWNAFPQYLHRDGWQEGEDSFNGENAMRGPLMMEMSGNESQEIYFGSISNFIKAVSSKLLIESIDGEIEIRSTENAIRLNGNEVIINNDLIFNKKETEAINYKNINWEIKNFSSEKNLNLLYKEETLEDLKIKLNYFGTKYPEYQTVSGASTAIPGLDANILIVDALNEFYSEVDDGNGSLTWSFSNFNLEDFITDHLAISEKLLLENIIFDEIETNATSITFKLVANSLKANYILELWDRIVWPDSGDPEDGTPVFYEMLLKKPWVNGSNYDGSYRFLIVEIDRGLPWYTHVLEVEDFSKEKTYKCNFGYSLNAFPYYHYGFNGKRFPINYIILNYEFAFINNKINKIDASLLNGINSFIRADSNLEVKILLKVEEVQNVKIKICMDEYKNGSLTVNESNHGSVVYESSEGKTFGGILKLIVEETLIDGILFLEAKAIVLGSTFYHRKFLPVSEL